VRLEQPSFAFADRHVSFGASMCVPARVRAWGARARGPGWPWGWARIAGGDAARKGAPGLGGHEFALRVICMQDRDCSQWRKYI